MFGDGTPEEGEVETTEGTVRTPRQIRCVERVHRAPTYPKSWRPRRFWRRTSRIDADPGVVDVSGRTVRKEDVWKARFDGRRTKTRNTGPVKETS